MDSQPAPKQGNHNGELYNVYATFDSHNNQRKDKTNPYKSSMFNKHTSKHHN